MFFKVSLQGIRRVTEKAFRDAPPSAASYPGCAERLAAWLGCAQIAPSAALPAHTPLGSSPKTPKALSLAQAPS